MGIIWGYRAYKRMPPTIRLAALHILPYMYERKIRKALEIFRTINEKVEIMVTTSRRILGNLFSWKWETIKVKLSPSKINSHYLLAWNPFKDDENCFLFHLKRSFRSQDVYVFVMIFWSCRKNRLIRKIRLTSKFMTSQPG